MTAADVLIMWSLCPLALLTERLLPANMTSLYDWSLASPLLFLFHVKIDSGKPPLSAHIISNKRVLFFDLGVWYFPWRAGFGQLYLSSLP